MSTYYQIPLHHWIDTELTTENQLSDTELQENFDEIRANIQKYLEKNEPEEENYYHLQINFSLNAVNPLKFELIADLLPFGGAAQGAVRIPPTPPPPPPVYTTRVLHPVLNNYVLMSRIDIISNQLGTKTIVSQLANLQR